MNNKIGLLVEYQKISFGRYLKKNKLAGFERYLFPWSFFVIIVRIIVNTLFIAGKRETTYFFAFNTVNFAYLLLFWTILPVFLTIGSFREIHLNKIRLQLLPLKKMDRFIFEYILLFLHPFFYLLLVVNLIIFFPISMNIKAFVDFLNLVLFLLVMISYAIFLLNVLVKRYHDTQYRNIFSDIIKLLPFVLVVLNYHFRIVDNRPVLVLFNLNFNIDWVIDSDCFFGTINSMAAGIPSIAHSLLLIMSGSILLIVSYYAYSINERRPGRKKNVIRLQPLSKLFSFLKEDQLYLEYKIINYRNYLFFVTVLSVIVSFFLYLQKAVPIVYIMVCSFFTILVNKYPFNSITGISSVKRYFLLPLSYRTMILKKNILFLIWITFTIMPIIFSCLLQKYYTETFIISINLIVSCLLFCVAGNIISIYLPSGKNENNVALIIASIIVVGPLLMYYKLFAESFIAYSVVMICIVFISIIIYSKNLRDIGLYIEKEAERILYEQNQ
ncbi:MAG: hypothetical protein KAU17_06265 [Spirochaetales bacterium]|nr:hypothetical protein [Spirochaetales bacterium]